MSHRYDVAGLGNAIVDIIASVDDRFLLTHKIAKGGMTLIDEFRAKELLKALADNHQALSGTHEIAGGSAANTMAGIASLGGNGIYVGKVFDDRLGKVFGDSMASLGMTFTTEPACSGASTATCMIAVTPDGQRSMSTYLGACRELQPDDIDEEQVAAARLLYIEGYLWDQDAAKQAARKAIAAVKGAGGRIALSLSDSFCVGRFRSEFLHLLDKDVNILFANEDEATALFEADNFEGVIEGAKKWGGIAA
ncbi:MAG TPA: adenosine kinase, partial [Rhizomicrobium sp.]|nr:adenosine kinase [Rhizomicrobium sp.]